MSTAPATKSRLIKPAHRNRSRSPSPQKAEKTRSRSPSPAAVRELTKSRLCHLIGKKMTGQRFVEDSSTLKFEDGWILSVSGTVTYNDSDNGIGKKVIRVVGRDDMEGLQFMDLDIGWLKRGNKPARCEVSQTISIIPTAAPTPVITKEAVLAFVKTCPRAEMDEINRATVTRHNIEFKQKVAVAMSQLAPGTKVTVPKKGGGVIHAVVLKLKVKNALLKLEDGREYNITASQCTVVS